MLAASAVTATGRVTHQHKLKLAADESYLAASLKVPPPKEKTVKTEVASQRKIAQREEARGHHVEAETKACSRVRFRLFLAFFEI